MKILRIILLLVIFVSNISTLAQNVRVTIRDLKQIDANTLQFDCWITNSGAAAWKYYAGQYFFNFNKNILNGGAGTLSIVKSDLPGTQQPRNPQVDISQSQGYLKLATNYLPGGGLGSPTLSPGTRLLAVRLELSTSAANFAALAPLIDFRPYNTPHGLNIAWDNSQSGTLFSASIDYQDSIIDKTLKPTGLNLNLTSLYEGFYENSKLTPDTVDVQFRNSSQPYDIMDVRTIVLDSNGTASIGFFNLENSTPYYLVLKHRSSIETWSFSPQVFSSSQLNYNFTTDSSRAYGYNLVLKNGKWCVFSGDINQDGFIDIFDDFEVYNDSYSGAYRLLTDLNLDAFVDIFDDFIVYNNSYSGVYAQYPGFPRPGALKSKKINNAIKEFIE